MLALSLDTPGCLGPRQVPSQEIEGQGDMPEDDSSYGKEVLSNTAVPYWPMCWSIWPMYPLPDFDTNDIKGVMKKVPRVRQEEGDEEESSRPTKGLGCQRIERYDAGNSPEDEG